MWTARNRRRYDRSNLRYPSDLTDDEWGHVAPLIPPARRGGNKRHVDVREVMNGIMYILSTGYLDLEFNSLDAQREACEAYIKSEAHEGWRLISHHYDDGAFSGASLERPALQRLLDVVRAGQIDIVVVYTDRHRGGLQGGPSAPVAYPPRAKSVRAESAMAESG